MSILLPITFQHYTRCQDFKHYYPLPRFSTLLPSTGIFYIITRYRDFLHYYPLPGIWTLLPVTKIFNIISLYMDFQHYYPLHGFSTLLPSTWIFYIITLYRDFLHVLPATGIFYIITRYLEFEHCYPFKDFQHYYPLQGFSTFLPASDIFNIITRTKILGCDFRSTFDPLNINLYNYFCINFILNIIPTEHGICSLIPNPAYWTTIITLNQNAIELKSTTPNASRSNYSRMC